MIRSTARTARKPQLCLDCERTIEPGECYWEHAASPHDPDVNDANPNWWRFAECSDCAKTKRRPVPRKRTPDRRRKLPDGRIRTTRTVQRCCNGCGEMLGDVTEAEIAAGVEGRQLPDVRAECPTCCKDLVGAS